MPILETKQSSFIAGAINDPRSASRDGFWYSENMECGKRKSLKQAVNNQVENVCGYDPSFCATKILEVDGFLYALGQTDNTSHHTAIWKKTAALTGDWAIPTNGSTSDDVINRENPFFCYIYPTFYFVNGGYLGKYNITTNTMTAQWIALPDSGVNGLKGGVPFMGKFVGWRLNKVYIFDPTAGTVTEMISIGSEQTVIDVIPYGDNLMIIGNSNTTVYKSKACLWDGVSTSTFIGIYDIGAGTVFGGVYYDGNLIVAMNSQNKKYIFFYTFNGVHFRLLYTYSARENAAGTYAYIAGASKLKIFGNYIYFLVTGTKPDDSYANYYQYAIARFGRDNANDSMAFSIYKTLDFGTVTRTLEGQTQNNDFILMESIIGGASASDRYVVATVYINTGLNTFFLSSAATYTAQPGVVETFKIDGHEHGLDASIEKTFKSVSVQFAPLPSGGSVTLKYRVNEASAWTTIFTHTIANSISHAAVNIEGAGVNLGSFFEAQFRIECLGGAELLGWKTKYEVSLSQSNY